MARPLAIEALIYRRVAQPSGAWPSTAASFRELARVTPLLRRVVIDSTPIREEVAELVHVLPEAFPALVEIVVCAASHVAARELEAALAGAPMVTVERVR
jgi:hypothetical protein